MPSSKRSAPEPSTGRRRSGRISSTAQKSSYFEDDTSDQERPAKKQRRGSTKRKSKPDSDDDEDQYKEEVDEVEDVDEDVDDDDEDDDDAPRKVTIIPLEKMRDAGGVEYEDRKLHKNTLLFLKDLKANNKRPWLKCEFGSQASEATFHMNAHRTTSTRRRVQTRSQGLAVIYRDDHPIHHRSGRDCTRVTGQGCHFPHPQRRSLQQGPNAIQGVP